MTVFAETPLQRVQDYWDSRPCNIRHSPREIGSRDYFDEVEARKYRVEPHIPSFADFQRWAGKRVLEIGCGIGTDTINFARAGAHVTAVDLSEQSLSVARQRASVYGLESTITFRQADAETLAEFIPAEPYDLVYSFGVIHHTPHPDRVMHQIRTNFMAPGSTFKVMVYNRVSWKVLQIVLTEGRGRFWKLDEMVARNSEAQTGCPVTYTYTRSSLARLLEGFRITDAQVRHIFPYRIPDYVQYRYVKNWYFRVLPEPVFQSLESVLGWHLCATAVLA